jgi:DNA-binding transcriptional LysR family regulator
MNGLEDLQLLRAFVRIVECGGISAAARTLNTTQPTLSRQLRQLERTAGIPLLRRDTRTMNLTDAGRRLFEDARQILDLAEQAGQRLRDEKDMLRGHLRVVAVVDLGQWIVSRLLALFQQTHPHITAELHLINRPCNFIEEGFDCGVMAGRITDTSVTARRATELNRMLVASPRLLKEKGPIRAPADLKQLPWMGLVQPHFYLRDQVTLTRGKEQSTVKLKPALLLDSVTALREAAIAGSALTVLPEWLLGDTLTTKKLMPVLPDWSISSADVNVVFPTSRHLPERVRAFVDFAVANLPRLIADKESAAR